MKKFLTRFLTNPCGATAIEYALLAMIALAIIGGLVLLGPELRGTFQDVKTDFQSANTH
ncbi:MAG: Flp family type IVb pilin [Proteobacteria bacterium]|nr:Flp family type IVb pilin [Pseudomonadota bacterium]